MRGKTLEQLVADAQAQIGHTAADTLKTAIDNNEPVIILDVRDKEQYDAEHLPGAISLPRAAIELEIDELVPIRIRTLSRIVAATPVVRYPHTPYKLWDTRTPPY